MAPVLISVDWGTSSLRAYLVAADGRVLDRQESVDGILSVSDNDFAARLRRATSKWRAASEHIPIVMSGMIGSRQGWWEVPYLRCPAGAEEIAGNFVALPGGTVSGIGPVFVVPGLDCLDQRGAPDVLRGEETQVLGALAALCRSDGTFVLPGTHSKWLHVSAGKITGFQTFMTGEVFAAMKSHTILGRLMSEGTATPRGFLEGVRAGIEPGAPGLLLNRMFATRTLGLFDRLPAQDLSDYLSGLLIGAELAAAGRDVKGPIVLIGASALCARYRLAAEQLGLSVQDAPQDVVVMGSLRLAKVARLIG